MPVKTTHTFVILELSRSAYEEIATQLRAADWHQAFMQEGDREVIDMHGIAVAIDPESAGVAMGNTEPYAYIERSAELTPSEIPAELKKISAAQKSLMEMLLTMKRNPISPPRSSDGPF